MYVHRQERILVHHDTLLQPLQDGLLTKPHNLQVSWKSQVITGTAYR